MHRFQVGAYYKLQSKVYKVIAKDGRYLNLVNDTKRKKIRIQYTPNGDEYVVFKDSYTTLMTFLSPRHHYRLR